MSTPFTLFRRSLRHAVIASSLALGLAVSGCGGGDPSGDDASTPPVTVPAGPTAAFTAAATAVAGSPVAFDAGASTSADGSALQYVWSFGDGQRGGGRTIAHAFAGAGAPSVTLTVFDAAGRSASVSRAVTVVAAAASGSVVVHARVSAVGGTALAGVSIVPAGGSAAPVTTDATGRADLTLARGPTVALKLTKAGYADQFVAAKLPAAAGTDTLIEATLTPRDAAQALADAHAGGSLAGRAGALLTLPADALVDGAGAAVTGPVQISLTPVDVTRPGAGGFPGRFDGIEADGAQTPIVSFGTVEFMLSNTAGVRLQLAPGKTATIEVPIWATQRLDGHVLVVGDTVPLWSLDEASAIWVREGTGNVVASADSPSGLAMRATVSHLSWWNADLGFDPYGPGPKCQPDAGVGIAEASDFYNTATVCNMLAEIDRDLGGNGKRSGTRRARSGDTRLEAPSPPGIAGYSRRVTVPIAGGVTVPVPAGLDVVLSASALNGTWSGRRVVNGAVGVQEDVVIAMRPTAVSGPGVEAIALPFDATRVLTADPAARFSFVAGANQLARITLQPGPGSTLQGNVRLLQGTTALASGVFGPATATLLQYLPAAGTYQVEVTATANAPGSFRVQVELIAQGAPESVPYPLDVTRTLPANTGYAATFSAASAGAAHIALRATAAQLRVLGPTGTVLFSGNSVGSTSLLAEVALPVAGSYTVQIAATSEFSTPIRLTAEPTSWLPVAPGLAVDTSFPMVGLVADRNGAPVAGFIRTPVVGSVRHQTIALRRWTGSAWESVGVDVDIDVPCVGLPFAAFAFDSGNAPVLVYARSSASGASTTTAIRFTGGAWQPLGPNGGVLPNASSRDLACVGPRVGIDASDRPTVAYTADSGLVVQRLDGGAWRGLATASGDVFALTSVFDLGLDSTGTPWLVQAGGNGGTSVVRRFDAGAGAWVGVGPNGGLLPLGNASGLLYPVLRFDAGGQPAVAAYAYPGGVAVSRFDGTAWSTTGSHQTAATSFADASPLGFALRGRDALVAWGNTAPYALPQTHAVVVQRNTASAWSAIGTGQGEVLPYFPHAITPDGGANDARLLVVGSDTYLVVTGTANSSSGGREIVLMKKVGD